MKFDKGKGNQGGKLLEHSPNSVVSAPKMRQSKQTRISKPELCPLAKEARMSAETSSQGAKPPESVSFYDTPMEILHEVSRECDSANDMEQDAHSAMLLAPHLEEADAQVGSASAPTKEHNPFELAGCENKVVALPLPSYVLPPSLCSNVEARLADTDRCTPALKFPADDESTDSRIVRSSAHTHGGVGSNATEKDWLAAELMDVEQEEAYKAQETDKSAPKRVEQSTKSIHYLAAEALENTTESPLDKAPGVIPDSKTAAINGKCVVPVAAASSACAIKKPGARLYESDDESDALTSQLLSSDPALCPPAKEARASAETSSQGAKPPKSVSFYDTSHEILHEVSRECDSANDMEQDAHSAMLSAPHLEKADAQVGSESLSALAKGQDPFEFAGCENKVVALPLPPYVLPPSLCFNVEARLADTDRCTPALKFPADDESTDSRIVRSSAHTHGGVSSNATEKDRLAAELMDAEQVAHVEAYEVQETDKSAPKRVEQSTQSIHYLAAEALENTTESPLDKAPGVIPDSMTSAIDGKRIIPVAASSSEASSACAIKKPGARLYESDDESDALTNQLLSSDPALCPPAKEARASAETSSQGAKPPESVSFYDTSQEILHEVSRECDSANDIEQDAHSAMLSAPHLEKADAQVGSASVPAK